MRLFSLVAICAFALTAGAARAAGGPWSWPAIPQCMLEPATVRTGTADPQPSMAPGAMDPCAIYTALTTSPEKFDVLDVMTARQANDELLSDADYPAFEPGTKVVHFRARVDMTTVFTGENRLVRVSWHRKGAVGGSWWTTFGQVSDGTRPLSQQAISDALALTYYPGCMATAQTVKAGDAGYYGIVAKGFSQRGGGIEFYFPYGDVVGDPDVANLGSDPACKMD